MASVQIDEIPTQLSVISANKKGLEIAIMIDYSQTIINSLNEYNKIYM